MVWWARIGKLTVWMLAFAATMFAWKIIELSIGDVWALAIYRTIVLGSIGLCLLVAIFGKAALK